VLITNLSGIIMGEQANTSFMVDLINIAVLKLLM
jgi:hypothetical protein